MPYELPTVEQFLARFPELAADAYDNADMVEQLINEAARSVDTTWLEADYQPAILFLAAHLWSTSPTVTGSAVASAGAIQSETLGRISVTYSSGGEAAAALSPTNYQSTTYGQQYWRLLRLNHPAIATY